MLVNKVANKNIPPPKPVVITACGCRQKQGFTSGWCGVAGGGVPACDH
jgi:hypothetical protein